MKSITIKKLYTLHSWVGLITGILLFVIAFSGAVAVFTRPELKIWSNQEIRAEIPIQSHKIENTIEQYAQKVGPDYLEEVHIRLPSARLSETARVIYEGHFETPEGGEEHKGTVFEFHPLNWSLVSKNDMDTFFELEKYDMSTFLAHFHADLHLGRPVGLILTGLLGLTLMVSIVTGLFIHRKILAQLFTFRVSKTFSLMLNDGHKVMSVWAVLFHSVIAFTGAFLGLATVILVPAAAYVGFNGDQEKLLETFTAIKAPIVANVAQPTKLADIIDISIQKRPDLTFDNVAIMGYGDQNALVYISGDGSEQLGGETLVFHGATAEYIRTQANFGRLEGVTGKILDAMFPLHFGNFGGLLVKCIWAILGLSTALVPITGLMLWIERGLNAQNPTHSKRTYQNFNKLLIGSCGGIVLATVALFIAQLIFDKTLPEQDHTSLIFKTFFGVWLGAIILPFVIKQALALKIIILGSGLLMVLIMPLDGLFTGSHVFNVFETQHYVSVSVDLTMLFLGTLLLVSYNKMSQQRHELSTTSVPQTAIEREA
ncbi:PepSY-associated TM helix domain-containing protein [Paraglaciecola marina]|uniref:PepSY-associated TM helix domain-containing protein n=1 Tax=Paraglaciecola marina TaxID=2500157 RepID=UPI001060E2F3|nr:PepSY-associated TM helix domain-containing protein [Paraglaciecola marina]